MRRAGTGIPHPDRATTIADSGQGSRFHRHTVKATSPQHGGSRPRRRPVQPDDSPL
ncbi:hypothetical protein P355_5315 [Burkholderia cenocepacia KC-01]|nr:hypothetical protein P355_5315 [Burkholderia cenocepacia KC-01]